MDIKKMKEYVKMHSFFPKYVKGVKYSSYTRHKLSGKDSHGNKVRLSEEEEMHVREGIKQFLKDIGYN